MSSTIIIADDHAIVRRGLRDLLQYHFRPARVVEVTSCAALLRSLREKAADLLILDLELEDGHATDILEEMSTNHPDLRILIYTTSPERVYAKRLLALGSSGFLSKQSNEEEVAHAVRRILQGLTYRSHEFELEQERQEGRTVTKKEDPFASLSQREISVMNELLRGTAVKDIAARLGLRPPTAATYKARLFDKLGVSNLLDLQRLVDAHRRQ